MFFGLGADTLTKVYYNTRTQKWYLFAKLVNNRWESVPEEIETELPNWARSMCMDYVDAEIAKFSFVVRVPQQIVDSILPTTA